MCLMWWAALAGAVLGGMDAKKKKRAHVQDQQVASTMTRYSPWTGMQGQVTTKDGDALGGVTKGALGGYLGGKNRMKDLGIYTNSMNS